MPTYRKEDYDRAKENGTWNSIGDMLQDGFTIQETNHEYYTYNQNNKDIEKRVPVYATNRVPAREVSKDIASSLYRFRHMAHNYKECKNFRDQLSRYTANTKSCRKYGYRYA